MKASSSCWEKSFSIFCSRTKWLVEDDDNDDAEDKEDDGSFGYNPRDNWVWLQWNLKKLNYNETNYY